MIKIENGNINVSQESSTETLLDFANMCFVIGNILNLQKKGMFDDKKMNDLMHSIISDCKLFDKLMCNSSKITIEPIIKYNGEKFGQLIQFPRKGKDKND